MNKISSFVLLFSFVLGSYSTVWSSGVGGYSASNTFTVNSANATNPKYKVASASISGDAVYVGVVASSDPSSVTFATGTDENNNTTYPFAGDTVGNVNSNVFNPDIQIPNFTASVSGAVTSIAVSYPGGYDSSGQGFSYAPDIIVDFPDSGNDGATATASLSSGEITSLSVSSGGSGYSVAPKVSVVGGPHFLRNTDTSSAHYGRYFLISSNTRTSLTLDLTRISAAEYGLDGIPGTSDDYNATDFFPAGTTVEVVPAPTLGSLFGRDTADLPTNWTSGIPDDADWIYVWDHTNPGYYPYLFLPNTFEPDWPRGWYSVYDITIGVQSKKIIYPDEAFIVVKKTAGNVTFTFEGTVQTSDQKMFLPEGSNQVLMNNPYGTDLLLGELVPSTSIGSGNDKFNPGTSASSADTDTIAFLQTDGSWTTFWYDSGSTSNVTASHVIGTRSPAPATTMSANDFYIGSGSIDNLESCDSDGSNTTTANNDKNYTKITISGGITDLQGFQITLASVQGYKLNDGGTKEANATTGLDVESPARGSIIYSNLIGTHEVVASGAGYVVIEKQRDVNFKSNEQDSSASNALANWAIGSLGTTASGGYTGHFYCVGGGASANAKGTVSSNGLTFTVTSGGTGYSAAPQVVVTGGGWRTSGSGTTARGDYVLESSSGVLVYRGKTTGVKTFLESSNPTN